MKTNRHTAILKIIEAKEIETQDELAEELKKAEVNVTQATVSRDIKELRLIKVLSETGRYKYATVDKAETGFMDRFIRIFAQSVISIESGGNLIVIKTISGSANVAAEAVDSMRLNEILGTIAGDNTVFVAVKNIENTQDVIEKFKSMMR